MDIDFIVRYLATEVSAKDKEQIEQWMKVSSKNREKIEQYKKIWETSVFLGKFDEIDETTDWYLIRNRFKPKYSLRVHHIPAWKYLIRAAAVIVVAVGLVYGLYFVVSSTQKAEKISEFTTDAVKTVELPDGTQVTLNRNSYLTYTSAFGIRNRVITMRGEGYFDVSRDTEHPFTINTSASTIQVVGTKLNIREDTSTVKVTVLSGKVRFFEKENKENGVDLSKNQTASFNAATKKIIYGTNDDLNFLTWKTGRFEFIKTPTTDALNTIADYFDKQLIIQTSIHDSITGVFDNQPLNEILKEIALTTSLKIDNAPEYIIIRK